MRSDRGSIVRQDRSLDKGGVLYVKLVLSNYVRLRNTTSLSLDNARHSKKRGSLQGGWALDNRQLFTRCENLCGKIGGNTCDPSGGGFGHTRGLDKGVQTLETQKYLI